MKQTAVEWLIYEIADSFKTPNQWKKVINQAKAMEKEQIMNAVNYGDERGKIATYRTAEQYYNETYRSQGSSDTTSPNIKNK
jgi:hypothetical protein